MSTTTSGRFQGRRAIVTGASRGIGAGIARRLAAEGAAVALVARTLDAHPTLPGSLTGTATAVREAGGTAAVVVADLARPDDVARVVPEAVAALGGPVDILVNNAAAAIYQPLRDYPARRLRLTLAVNVEAPFALMQAALPAMRAAGQGWIVNLSSASGRLQPGPPFSGVRPEMGVYGASKAALNRITNAVAAEVAGEGVRVNTVEPRAGVLTEGVRALLPEGLGDDQLESLDTMVEAAVALCACAPDLTGRVTVSRELIEELGLMVRPVAGEGP